METQVIATEIEDDEEDYDYDYDDLLGEDDWEDADAITAIKAKRPDWHLVKAVNFTYGSMSDMQKWCVANCTEEYEHVGWHSGCSYTVGVHFSSHVDAILFKLTWSGI